MKTFNFQKYLVRIFDNPIGRLYLDVPKGKKIYKITKSSVHYYTGELSKKNGLPVICTGNCSPGGKFVFNRIMRLARVVSVFALLPLFPKSLLPLVALSDTGYKSATATGGTYNDWTNPTNAYTSNNQYASAVFSYVKQSYEDFDFGVPSGATINGIQIQVEGYTSAPSLAAQYFTVYSTSEAEGKGKIWDLPTSEGTITMGGSDDLWGTSWISSDFSDANFYFYIMTASGPDIYTAYVDHLQIKVYYTEITTYTKKLTARGRIKQSDITKKVTVKARLQTTPEKILTARADIKAEAERKLTARTRVEQSGIIKTIQSRGRIKISDIAKGLTSRGKVLATQEKALLERAKIKATIERILSSRARLKTTTGKTLTSRGRTKQTDISNALTSQARIQTLVEKVLLVLGRIEVTSEKEVTIRGLIEATQEKTITSRARVKATIDKLLALRSRVQALEERQIQSLAKVKRVGEGKLLTAEARIKQESIEQKLTALARIEITAIESISTARGRVKQAGVEKKLTSRSRIKVLDITKQFQVRARVQTLLEKILSSKGRIEGLLGKVLTARGKIVSVGKVMLYAPTDESSEPSPVTFEWYIPSSRWGVNMNFHLQIDKTDDSFGDLETEKRSWQDVGMEYWNDAEWVSVPAGGIGSAYDGNKARYVISTLTAGIKFWRVRAFAG